MRVGSPGGGDQEVLDENPCGKLVGGSVTIDKDKGFGGKLLDKVKGKADFTCECKGPGHLLAGTSHGTPCYLALEDESYCLKDRTGHTFEVERLVNDAHAGRRIGYACMSETERLGMEAFGSLEHTQERSHWSDNAQYNFIRLSRASEVLMAAATALKAARGEASSPENLPELQKAAQHAKAAIPKHHQSESKATALAVEALDLAGPGLFGTDFAKAAGLMTQVAEALDLQNSRDAGSASAREAAGLILKAGKALLDSQPLQALKQAVAARAPNA